MTHAFICDNGPRHVTNDLVHIDQHPVGTVRMKNNRFHMRIDFAPLLCPVSANLFMSSDETTLERPRPGHVWRHQGEGGVDVPRVEGCVSGTEQLDRKSTRLNSSH